MITDILRSVNKPGLELTYVTTRDHGYTVGSLGQALEKRGVRLRVRSYDGLFRRKRLPLTTYVFTDFDRLSTTELEAAAAVATTLRNAGSRVLNDPRHYRPRPQMMHFLRSQGLNPLHAWEPAADQWPDRYPVLLRTIAAHRGPLGELVHDAEQARERVKRAIDKGHAVSDLAFIEYAGEKIEGQGFRKYAVFLVGDRMIRANTVTDATWKAKQGTIGLTNAEFYAHERVEAADYPREAHMRRVFAALGYDFGRIDYGIVDGKPIIYEINSNPQMQLSHQHPNADRRETMNLMRDSLLEALTVIASPTTTKKIEMDGVFPVPARVWIRRPRRY